jgi:hypothetical protein
MSAEWRVLRNAATQAVILNRVRLCRSFWCHFRGLQLVRRLPEDEGLLFVTSHEGRAHTAIHMFFMFFSIGVVWLDAEKRVVDKQLAKPWRPAYTPAQPAQYYLEANTGVLDQITIGDKLVFDETAR